MLACGHELEIKNSRHTDKQIAVALKKAETINHSQNG